MALLAGLTAACSSDGSRYGSIFTGSTANQKQIIGGGSQPMPAPVDYSNDVVTTPPPARSVSRSDLPMLPGVQQGSQQVAAAPSYNAPSYDAPRGYTPPAASASAQQAAAPMQVASAAQPPRRGGAWTTEGGTVVTLGPGETLSSVSRRYGVPIKELARVNNIANPSAVGTGTRLTIPTYGMGGGEAVASAVQQNAPQAGDSTRLVAGPVPAAERKPVASGEGAPLNGLHTVSPGQTLSSIGRLYGVSAAQIAAANNLTSNNQLKSGQKLRIPGNDQNPQAVALRNDPSRREEKARGEDPNSKPLAANAPQKGTQADPTTTAAIGKPGAPSPGLAEATAVTKPNQPVAYEPPSEDKATATNASLDPGSANGTTFRWPVRGRIITGFGASATGEKNDGINLAVPEGTSIKAAEAGTVIYAGNELEGYGNLVLVRHADGWVSAYAHNSKILVKRGDTVRRGQIISQAGSSGSVNAPQLHFELRRGSKPVNPLDYLQG
ncbi:lipoprotein [Kaistia sp. 32K]|uniref:peptidoglycan DD-metalloendopeptidase family protein n=1 Tax=Kaistia sp. 32K TaxID=2795690 RepID=UPI0019164F5F|nr:peptidoglycan DD-metalloendopeptidase family protein [Kaistia sp. 32K]BCP53177.1 lipoprotein [Kaistia sp. 32K]